MRTDILREFMEKLNSFIGDCEKIRKDDHLYGEIDCKPHRCGRVSIYESNCYLYTVKERYYIQWDCHDIIVYFSYDKQYTKKVIFKRNEFDPIILCLEQPNLRKVNNGTLSSILELFDAISDKIKFYELKRLTNGGFL